MSKSKIFLILLFATIVAYGSSVFYGFSQDDWFHLSISKANSLQEFINFFNPLSVSWIFFRPLSTQLPYFLGSKLFDLTQAPQYMHIAMLLIHALNAYLVVQVSRKYLKSEMSYLLGIIYAISNIHFLSLFYIGAIQQLISTLFSLLTILLFLKRPRGSQIALAMLTLAALLSKELSIRLPMILFVLSIVKERNILSSLKATLGPIIVTFLYFATRYFFGSTSASEYQIVWNLGTTLATTMWYGLFSLGFPEELLHYGLSGGMIDFASFVMMNPLLRVPIVIGSVILAIFICQQLYLTLRDRREWHYLAFPFIAFLSISPIIFLPTHRYPHYLDLFILFVGIWLLRSITKINLKIIVISAIISIGMISSIAVEMKTHWTIKRAIISRRVESVLIAQGNCTSLKELAFVGDGTDPLEVSYAMSLMNGPRIICNNLGLQVYYISGQLPRELDRAMIIDTKGIIR